MSDYLDLNRANWDERAPAHAASPDYGLARFAEDPDYVSEVIQFDLPRLGDIAGLRGVHLQCHIGTDTISLSRLGARMTGLDFSPAAISQARALAARAGADVTFVESDVYAAVSALGAGEFGLVFTGIGALCWLPDIRRWASVVSELLKPGGRLFIRDGHPVLQAIDDEDPGGRLVFRHPYFEPSEPLVSDYQGTYVATDVVFTSTVTHWWNHGIGEIVTALLDARMRLTELTEHDSVPWNAIPGQMTKARDGEWRLTREPRRVPLTFTLQAVKD